MSIHLKQLLGGMPEWLIGAVLKTVVRASVPRVRIPIPPPFLKSPNYNGLGFLFYVIVVRYLLIGLLLGRGKCY